MFRITGTRTLQNSTDQAKRPTAVSTGVFVTPAPKRGVTPKPYVPPARLSFAGVSTAPGQVVQNAHSGSPDVIPWTPLTNLQKRVAPYEKLPPWKSTNPALVPQYAEKGMFLDPQILINYDSAQFTPVGETPRTIWNPPGSEGSGVGGGGGSTGTGGSGGQSPGGGGGALGGGGGHQLK